MTFNRLFSQSGGSSMVSAISTNSSGESTCYIFSFVARSYALAA